VRNQRPDTSDPLRRVSPVDLIVAVAVVVCVLGCTTRAQRLYRRAEAFLAQDQCQLAAVEYNRIVKDSPQDPLADDALYKLAYLYREELDNSTAALQSYRYLADNYPDSSFADDALLWIVYMGRRDLHSPDVVVSACREIDQRFADDSCLRAQAWLEAARAYRDAGQLQEARRRCEAIIEDFGDEQAVAAAASLMVADIAREQSTDPQMVVALYEQVIKQYPQTRAAAKARQAAGWVYYGVKAKSDEQRLAQQRRQAQVLEGVPPIDSYPNRPAIELLSAMQSLLQQAGAPTSLDELMVLSGLAFGFCCDLDHPEGIDRFYRNPLTLLAEEMGFGYNLWGFAETSNALAAVTKSLQSSRPLLISYGKPQPRPALIIGYKPADKELHLTLPGRGSVVVSEEAFAEQWKTAQFPRLWTPPPETGCQFSLTTGREQSSETARIKSAALRAALALDQPKLMGAPAGRAGYEAFLSHIRNCLPSEATAARQQLSQWTGVVIPRITFARRAAAQYLSRFPASLRGPARLSLAAASDSYNDLVQRWGQLGEEIEKATEQPRSPVSSSASPQQDEIWRQILQEAETICNQEQQTLQDLAAALRDIETGIVTEPGG